MNRIALFVSIASLLLPVAVTATPGDSYRADLGNHGELYRIRQVDLEQEEGASDKQAAARPALVVDIVRSDGPTESLVVPTTETTDPEFSPYTLFEEKSETLYVVWESRLYGIYSQIRLAWLSDGVWSEVLEISGNPYTRRGAPRFTITKDTYLDSENTRHERTALHMVWWEDTHTGGEILYTPVVLIDGVYAGQYRPSRLLDLLDGKEADESFGYLAPHAEELIRNPLVQKARQQGEVLGAFARSGPGRIMTFRLSVVPVELARIGEKLRAHMIEIGHDLEGPEGVERLADKARAHMIEIGQRLGPPVRNALAEAAYQFTLDEAAENFDFREGDVAKLGDKLRAHMIEIGLTLRRDGASPVRTKSRRSSAHVATLQPLGLSEVLASIPQLITVELVSEFELPETGTGPKDLHLSEDARDILVSWNTEDAVEYRESSSEGWTEKHRLELNEQMSLERVREVLARRTAQR